MENKSHALITGLFTLLLGLALALAAVWLSRDTTVRVAYELVTRASIAGLSTQSAVRYRGLEVGKVESIGFDPKVPGQILVRIAVQKGTPLTRSTFATLGYQGVTGLAYIQLDDKGGNPQLLETSPESVARIDISPGMLDNLTARGEAILVQVEEVTKRLNTLLDPSNQKILAETLISLGTAAKDVDKITASLQPALAHLPNVALQTQKTLQAVSATSDEFARLAARLQERGGAIERVSASLEQLATTGNRLGDTLATTTLPRLNALVDHLAVSTLPRVNTMVDSTANGVRSVCRVVEKFGEQPQSLIFGQGAIAPGPGERGYVAPGGAR